MIGAIVRRPVLAGIAAYASAVFVLGIIEGIRYRRTVNRRLADFRRDLESRAPYLDKVRAASIAQEPENAR